MHSYYDVETGDWVTDWSRYEPIRHQARYAPLDDLIYTDPDGAWPLVLDLIAELPDDLVSFVGSGEIETLVVLHGTALIDRIVKQAAEDPRFRRCLLEVNLQQGKLPAQVEQAFVAAAGPKFWLLAPIPPELP